MSQIINTIFENGVFKPLEEINIKEHEKVQIKIVSHDEWQNRFNSLINRIHKKAVRFAPEEIESDIKEAIKEVRAKKNDHKSGY